MRYCGLIPAFFHLLHVKRLYAYCMAACALVLFFPAWSEAHKVNIFAYAQDGRIYAEGYFVDGTKCKNSVVEVIDGGTGDKLLQGKTDDNGQVSFPIPRVTALKLILHAGEGHQNDYTLSEDEVRDAMPEVTKKITRIPAEAQTAAPAKRLAEPEQPGNVQDAVHPAVSSDEVETMIERVIDRKLQPVIKMLVDLQEKSGRPTMTEILGGIGYIIGILGLIAYFKGRRRDR